MAAPIRSLADALRRFDDDRLTELIVARPDLGTPVPRGIGPLAARAAAAGSVQRALSSLTRPELCLAEALVVLPEPVSPAALAAAVGADATLAAPFLRRLASLALSWGDEEIRPVRTLREVLRTPAGLAPEHDDDPSPQRAAALVSAAPESLRTVLGRLAWGPAHLDGGAGSPLAEELLAEGLIVRRGDALEIPRPVHLVLRGGRVRESLPSRRPRPDGAHLHERIAGGRTAQAADSAFEAVRILGTVRTWDDDPPAVLRRGGIPQRDVRRLARQADTEVVDYATVIQTAWSAGLLGHDGEAWQPTADWDAFRARGLEERWAELAATWVRGHHLAALLPEGHGRSGSSSSAGRTDPSASPAPGADTATAALGSRALLSAATARDGVRARRLSALRVLRAAPGIQASVEAIAEAVGWAFPLVAPAIVHEEAHAVLAEATVLGLVVDGTLSVLGEELVDHLDDDVTGLDARLARKLREVAPPPVDEVLLDADLTVTIPGRPSERLLELLAWADVVSRGGALTLRLTPASVRHAMTSGRDAQTLRALLAETSMTPIPQTLDYLLRDEARRHGQVRIGRSQSHLTADPDVLSLLEASPHAAALGLQRLAPTVAVSTSDAGFVLQMVRRAGLSAIAVGPDGRTADDARDHTLHGGPVDTALETAAGPELRLPAPTVVARIREAEDGVDGDPSVTDRLLEAIAEGSPIRLGIVDGRGGIIERDAVPVSLEGGRLRARDVRGADEFTVLVHRVTLG